MKKLIFIVMMLFVANSIFSDPIDDNAEEILLKSEEYYQEFQQRYKALKAYDASAQSNDELKQLTDMISRYKRVVEDKIIEIEGIERTGRPVPTAEFNQLKILINRYHEMSVDLANWLHHRQ